MTKFNLNDKGNTTVIVIAVVALIIVASLLFVFNQNKNNESDKIMTGDNAMMEDDGIMESDNSDDMMEAGDTMTDDDEDSMMTEEDTMKDDDKKAAMEEEAMSNDATKEGDSMMKEEGQGGAMIGVDADVEMMMAASGEYKDYSASAYQAAEGQKRVLFFHAAWCPICKVAHNDIMSRLDEIPADVVLFKTDYDQEKELVKKYGVTYQHTYVQVNASGEVVSKWNGGDIDELKKNVK